MPSRNDIHIALVENLDCYHAPSAYIAATHRRGKEYQRIGVFGKVTSRPPVKGKRNPEVVLWRLRSLGLRPPARPRRKRAKVITHIDGVPILPIIFLRTRTQHHNEPPTCPSEHRHIYQDPPAENPPYPWDRPGEP